MNELLAAMLTLTPVTMAATEAAKRLAGTRADINRYVPAIAIALGIAGAFLFPPEMIARDEIATGVLSGFAAAGIWSGTKTALGK